MFQIFYFGSGQGSSEEHSVRFAVRRGDWQELIAPLPALAPGFRLRLDPPGERGLCLIESMQFTPQLSIAAPAWPKPTVLAEVPGSLVIRSGELVLTAEPARVGWVSRHGGWTADGHGTQSALDRLS